MHTSHYWKIIALFLLYTTIVVHCQDEDDDEEEVSTEEEATSTTEATTTDAAANIIEDPALGLLIQEALSNANRASPSTTVSPQNVSSGNSTVDAVVLSALVNAALENANRQTEQPSSLMNQEELVVMMKQLNKILNSVAKGNIIGVVRNSLKVRAPPAVQGSITDTVRTFVEGRKEIEILGIPVTQIPVIIPTNLCNCPVRANRAGGSPQAEMEFIMNQLNKILENVAYSNMSGIVENALKIRAPESVQGIITNTVKIFMNGGGVQGLGLSAYSCPCLRPAPAAAPLPLATPGAAPGAVIGAPTGVNQLKLDYPKPLKANNIATFSQNRIQKYRPPLKLPKNNYTVIISYDE